MKRLSLSGEKIGMLTVLGYSHSHIQPSGQKRAMWDVLCECGTRKKMSTSTLKHQKTVSCGCYLKEKLKSGIRKSPNGEANFNYIYISYQHRAKNKNIDFKLTKDEFRSIITQKCKYCGLEGYTHRTRRSNNGLFISNGIDRVDSNVGYLIENCVPCCKICNMMKRNYDLNYFLEHISKIYKHNKLC